MLPDFSPLPSHVCMDVCMKERKRLNVHPCIFVTEWETWHRAGLYRLATPVRGQSVNSRKCVHKWGSYFYCFYHFSGSAISLFFPHSLSHSFLEHLLTFSLLSSPTLSSHFLPSPLLWTEMTGGKKQKTMKRPLEM